MDRKKNCWEVMQCGLGPGNGAPACVAARESRLDGIHGGENAGRACWVVAGTFCFDKHPSGTFAQRMETCFECRFYQQVLREEDRLHPHFDLLTKVR